MKGIKKGKREKILVTGGAGFIGSHLANYLIKLNYKVVVIDNLVWGFPKVLRPEIKFIKGDLRKKKEVFKALRGCQKVIHAAALINVWESYLKPELYFKNNILGTINLLEVMRQAGVKDIVFSSSAAVYSPQNKIPIPEEGKLQPLSPYGTSKLIMEELLYSYHRNYHFNVAIFRYFNPYGPGEYKFPPQHVIPIFFLKAFANQPLPVHGKGELIRDYIYIQDLVEAHLLGLSLKGFHVYNIGSGKGCPLRRLVKLILKISRSKSPIEYQIIPFGYKIHLYADISKIKKELGWQPKTPLEKGLKKTAKFFKNFFQELKKIK